MRRGGARIRAPHPAGAALLAWSLLTLLAAGCAAGPPVEGGPAEPAPRVGSLRQDEISLTLVSDDVRFQITPLASTVLEATAPDTRRRLSSLVPSGSTGTHLLVSVFTEAPGGRTFEPADVVLENRGRTFRPTRIRGLTPGWGSGPLRQQRPEQAVYTFSEEVDLELPLTVVIAGVRNSAWESIRPRIDAERARIGASGR